MEHFRTKKAVFRLICLLVLPQVSTVMAAGRADTNAASDQHIRQIVENLLHEKDQKIEQLEARIKQLETKQNPDTKSLPQTKPALAKVEAENTEADSSVEGEENLAKSKTSNTSILNKLGDLGEEIAELKESAEEKGLDIKGFFDVNAKSDNSTDQTFSVGSVELDLEFAYNDHFAASSALVLCGNSAGVDYSAPAAISCGGSGPGGLGGGGAGIAVALIDYHQFDNSIPPRGRIFNNQGFHIQAGRFDLPFSTDYQNFANSDRVTVTAPITTSRMQFGGFNGDGIRSYGS
jgi:hypothetical protein